MNNSPLISIIIPTLNSSYHIETLLKSIKKQKFNAVEIIIADNGSSDLTLSIANKYNAKIIKVLGTPPQVARQRNLGAKAASGKYIYFMDHDMELSENFLKHFWDKIQNKRFADADAWYIPEKIVSKSKLLSIARNFEAEFINGTVVSAARIIKKREFFLADGFDEKLSGGPADWDLDIQLRLKDLNFAIFDKFVYHHEENLSIWSYIFKKTKYINGEEIYKKKWKNNAEVYKNIIVKQYNLRYRVLWIFIENKKWKKLVKRVHRYVVFLIIKFSMIAVYVYWRNKYVK
jgi:glycosyltransferase involved in cell wall biosynthesis